MANEVTVAQCTELTVVLDGKRVTVAPRPGASLLHSARVAGLQPPSSCETGNCATCIALVLDGEVRMRNNEVLDDDEVAEGWVLTCQGVPSSASVHISYDE